MSADFKVVAEQVKEEEVGAIDQQAAVIRSRTCFHPAASSFRRLRPNRIFFHLKAGDILRDDDFVGEL